MKVKDCFSLDDSLFVVMEQYPMTLLAYISPVAADSRQNVVPSPGLICPK